MKEDIRGYQPRDANVVDVYLPRVKKEIYKHSVHTGGRSGGGGGGLLLLHAAWRHGARIEEPPPPCRVSGQLDRV